MALAYHLGLRRLDNGALAESRSQLVRLVRSVLTLGRDFGLVVFGFGDHHLHLKTKPDREAACELARRLALSFGRLLNVSSGIARSFIKPVENGRYLYTLFRYVLEQPEKHGTVIDPSCEATAIPDLLGLRPKGAYLQQAVRSLLPRVSQRAIFEIAGVPCLEPAPEVEPIKELVPATLAAAALPNLEGYDELTRVARRAAMAVAEGKAPNTKLATLLDVGRSTLYALRAQEPVAKLVSAIRGQISLRSWYAERRAAIEARHRNVDLAVDAALRR
jgi:hypothetical protein